MPFRPHLLIALLLAVGCAGSGEGLDRFGRPIPPEGLDTSIDPYFFVQQVHETRCVKCHDGPGAPKGLDLRGEESYDRIVSVPSKEVPAMLLVEPEHPANSYIWAKVAPEHEQRIGSRMPRDGPPYLDEFQLEDIRSWIAEGALRDEEAE
ncbi:MAG: hypothetical protein JRJ84_17900 [Deltaproteobacteria bacterium]|nr:hypothetical protein [Deltaproteobacteria bacterium]